MCFEESGAHYTIETMAELPALIETINARLNMDRQLECK